MQMCQAFARSGHHVTHIAGEDRLDEEPGVSNVYMFYGVNERFDLERIRPWRHPRRGWHYSWKTFRAIEVVWPDLVYGRNVRGCAMAALRGFPTILELHTLHFARSVGDRLILLVLGRLQALKRIVVISNGLKKDLQETLNLDDGRIQVVHDGANLAGEYGKPPELPADTMRLQVGYIGHLYAGRGIELIGELGKRLADVDFHLVGGLPADINRLRHAVVLPPNLHLHGFRPYRDAEAFRTHCDVLVAPYQRKVGTHRSADTSRWMSPLKIFEYMAAGKAIVCSDLPVLREVLEHERTALLVPPDDIDAWASAIRLLGQDPKLRRRFGAAALQEFRVHYTWQQRARDVLQGIPSE